MPQLTHGEVGVFRAALGLRQREGRARARLPRAAALAEGVRETVELAARHRTGARRIGARGVSLGRGEALRRLVHIGCGAFALLLRVAHLGSRRRSSPSPPSSSTGRCCPRIGGKGLWRGGDVARGYPLGILLYPLAVLGLILVFHDRLWMAAAVWGILAVGDGMASLVGQAVSRPAPALEPAEGLGRLRLPSSRSAPRRRRSSRPGRHAGPSRQARCHWPRTLGVALALALLCALVESLPTTLDDNLTVPLAVALVLPLLAAARPRAPPRRPGVLGRAVVGLGRQRRDRGAGVRRALDRRARAPSPRSSSAP